MVTSEMIFIMLHWLTANFFRSYRDDDDAVDGISYAEARAFRK
jgi:hypothetical protein